MFKVRGRGSPDHHWPRTIMISDRSILGHQIQSMLNCRRVDQSIGGVARKRGGKSNRRVRDCRGHANRSKLRGEALQPGSDRNGDSDPLIPRKPRQLVPGNRRHDELVRFFEGPSRRGADPFRLRRPPVDHVGVEQNRGHAYEAFQVSAVENRASSFTAVIATPSNEPLRERAPDAGTRRATGRPCLVISISSPAAASSKRRRIVAFASVAVTCLAIWSV